MWRKLTAGVLLSTVALGQVGSGTITVLNPALYEPAAATFAGFNCRIQNTGSVADTFSVVASSSLPPLMFPDPNGVLIQPGQEFLFDVFLSFSPDVYPGTLFLLTLDLSSLAGASASASATLTILHPPPALLIWQTGPGMPVNLEAQEVFLGLRYRVFISNEPCALGPGAGPFLGLCSTQLSQLVAQALAPFGTLPWHFEGNALVTPSIANLGSYPVPPGFVADCILLFPNFGSDAATRPWLTTAVQRYTTI